MAGSERAGFAEARADLFEGATVILTPTERTPPDAVTRVRGFWEAVGGRVTVLDPTTHDRAVAAVSHLPHLVADALVDAVLRMDPAFLDVAARGFRDTTRIAASSPEIWREIFQDNRAALGRGGGRLSQVAGPPRGRARRRATPPRWRRSSSGSSRRGEALG